MIPNSRKLLKGKNRFNRASANLILDIKGYRSRTEEEENQTPFVSVQNVEIHVPTKRPKYRRASDFDEEWKKIPVSRMEDDVVSVVFIQRARKLIDSLKRPDDANIMTESFYEEETPPRKAPTYTVTHANSTVVHRD